VTYPQQQPYPPAQPAYPPQQQPYPPAQPAYPPQQQPYPPAQPAYPPQQQGYGQQNPWTGNPYAAPELRNPPPPPLAKGSVDDFYEQPAASGKSISFNGKPFGTSYTGYIARPITNADIQQQTAMHTRLPLTHPDGSPKWVMIVPLTVTPDQEFPDGRATWYVKGSERAELERAMDAAGVPLSAEGHMPPPEAGARVTITYTGDRPVPNMNPQKMKAVTYERPANLNGNGVAPAQHQQPQYQAPYGGPGPGAVVQGPDGGLVPTGPGGHPQQPQYQQPVYGQPQADYIPPPPYQPAYQQPDPAIYQQPDPAIYQQATGQAPQQQYAPQLATGQAPPQLYATQSMPPPAPQDMAMPADLTPDQQERLRQLTGQ
jgi:hypothetical protein